MKSALAILLCLLVGVSSCPYIYAQTPTSQQQEDVIRVRSNEVKLDVVVKDKKSHPVRNLKAADFEIYEDGVLQKIESFNYLSREFTPEPGKDSKSEPITTTATGAPNS